MGVFPLVTTLSVLTPILLPAIRTATAWYQSHIERAFGPIFALTVALVTDDADNRRKAAKDGVTVFSVGEYVDRITGHPELHDTVANKIQESALATNSGILYPEVGGSRRNHLPKTYPSR